MHQENINLNVTVAAEQTILQWWVFGVSIVAVLVAIVTAGGVIWNVYVTRKTAIQQATLEFLDEYKSDKRIFEASELLVVLQGKKDILSYLICKPDMENFIFLLNKCQMLAVGLRHEIYDEEMVYDSIAWEIVKVYKCSKSFIEQIRKIGRYRTSHKKPFLAFEILAKKFQHRLEQQEKCVIIAPMSEEISAKDAKDHLIKHLEMIQGVVNRLAHCSFLIKGWSMTILAAVVVFLARSGMDSPNILLAFLAPIIGFWFLDAYYLWQERLFREAYDKICDSEHTDFAMPKRKVKLDREYLSSLFSSTVFLFYAIEFIFLAAVFFILS